MEGLVQKFLDPMPENNFASTSPFFFPYVRYLHRLNKFIYRYMFKLTMVVNNLLPLMIIFSNTMGKQFVCLTWK